METVNVHEAKTHLSRLLRRVEAGEEILISRAGVPIARLSRFHRSAPPRRGGQWRGLVRIGEDFDDPLPWSVEGSFYGDEE